MQNPKQLYATRDVDFHFTVSGIQFIVSGRTSKGNEAEWFNGGVGLSIIKVLTGERLYRKVWEVTALRELTTEE